MGKQRNNLQRKGKKILVPILRQRNLLLQRIRLQILFHEKFTFMIIVATFLKFSLFQTEQPFAEGL